MKTDRPQRKYLSEYAPPDFTILQTRLEFELSKSSTRVKSWLTVKRFGNTQQPLILDGVGLKLLSISMDGHPVPANGYHQTAEQLSISDVSDHFELIFEVEINPSANTRLEGLYLSNGHFCTQCEAEGFRYITYYIDRPDVMSVFSTRIYADKKCYPVLLSNGNRVASGEQGDLHWVEWHDPYPKPSYLFALVAGDLACIEGCYTTVSSRRVDLQIYTEHHNREKCDHALRSLQKAMRWDEVVFGLEYDLELYMIVAVDDFNMGAMENKGLNIFNSQYVLASAETATDDDFLAIESVIAHEYFHNWTGNRVTCRDWFQLSLKEGLTVFRDQQFSADIASRAIQRINDVRVLRQHQFVEDAGPMAHPVRPASYQEINNFYTATVYNKGAEVVRMMHTLLGAENFRKGMDLYFRRHDGKAVTTDDFRFAMQDASGVNLDQFQRWYEQSGTPEIFIERHYDAARRRLELQIRQNPGFTKEAPNLALQMPMRLSLFNRQGEALPLDQDDRREWTVNLRQTEQTLTFEPIDACPMVSAFRGFSAPIKLTTDLHNDELALLMQSDTDPFNQWEAGQQYASRVMLNLYHAPRDAWSQALSGLVHSYGKLLSDQPVDLALLAEMMVLPSEKYLAEMLHEPVDVHRLIEIRQTIRLALATAYESIWLACYQQYHTVDEYRLTADAMARRRFKNLSLSYLLMLQQDRYFELCRQQFDAATNMTDQMGCLLPIVDYNHATRDCLLQAFYQQWQHNALVMDKWFAVQGSCHADNALAMIMPLFEHPLYTLHNPNRARSLLGALIRNSRAFHQNDGAGYQFVADRIMQLDAINPQVAARMGNAFVHWKRFIPAQSNLMKVQIERMLNHAGLSNDLHELLTSSLEK